MSNKKNENLLNDDELEKIGGGMTYSISSVESGDVFISKENPNMAFVIMADTTITSNDTEVPFVDAAKSENGWRKGGHVQYKPLSWLLIVANYSPELSRRI